MGAYVEDRFEGGFLLDEARLRKIVDIITNRIRESFIRFKVFRGDSYTYITSNINDVICEDNEDWRAITKLQIKLCKESPLEFNMSFSEEGVSLYITGEDRDTVFLLLSEIREYAKNDLLRRPPLTERAIKNAGIVLVLITTAFMVITVGTHNFQTDSTALKEILETSNVNDKLNFLITERHEKNAPTSAFRYVFIAMFTTILLLLTAPYLQKMWNFIYPSNEFLFGARKKKYEARMTLLGKLFWGVGVALAVGIVASFIAWAVTK